jgi:hypothetical protein
MAEGDATMARMLRNMELTQDWEGPRQPNGLPDLSQTPAFGRQGFEAFAKEHGPGVAIDAASMATGPIGRGMSAVAGAMRSWPKLSALLLGGAGAGAISGEAEDSTLTKKQRRQQEIKAQDQKQALEAERVRAEIEAAAQKQAAEQGLAIEMARKQQEDEFARQQAAKDAVKPFRETHPQLNAAMPYLAGATALAVPAAIKGGMTLAQALKVPAWREAISGTRAAVEAGDVAKATMGAKELAERNASHAASQGGAVWKTPVAGAAGGAAGTEVSMIPSQSDWYALPAGNPDHDAGKKQSTDPIEIAKRMTMLSALGMSGYKLAGAVPGRTAPIEESRGLAGLLKEDYAGEAAAVARNIAAMRGQSALQPQSAGALGQGPNTPALSMSEVLRGGQGPTSQRALPPPLGTGSPASGQGPAVAGTSGQPGANLSAPASQSPRTIYRVKGSDGKVRLHGEDGKFTSKPSKGDIEE